MVVVRTPFFKRAGLLLLTLGCTALGVLCWVQPFGGGILVRATGAGFLLLGLPAGGIALRRFLRPSAALVLERGGIVDNASAAPAGFIAWEEITRIAVLTVSGRNFVSIDVKDREALYGRCRAAALLRANAAMTGYPVNLPDITLDRPPRELCDLIEGYWRDPAARAALGRLRP
jgi:hypothetical protein